MFIVGFKIERISLATFEFKNPKTVFDFNLSKYIQFEAVSRMKPSSKYRAE